MIKMESKRLSSKPHAIFIPHPLQGHINPMIKLAQRFHQNDFYVTFINAEFIQKSLFQKNSTPIISSDFNFETYSDGIQVSDAVATPDLFALCESSRYKFYDSIRKVIMRVNDDVENGDAPKISCVIADILMPFTTDIAREIGVRSLLFWTASACSLLAYRNYRLVNERGPLPVTDETSDNIVDWIPGLTNIPLRDLSFLDSTRYDYPMKEISQASKDISLIINTFDSLEHEALSTLSSIYARVYAIGPLQIPNYPNPKTNFKPISFNFWEQETQCLEWLDLKEPNSVIYISFGSLIFMTMDELIEFAWGIINSNYAFLWVIRANMINNEPTQLPGDLLARARERGFITNWCPQEEVINHKAIGRFMTHCGWNSTLDSLCSSVPIICWPRIGDQLINCRYSCNDWGIGMEINRRVTRDEVSEIVRNSMDREKGKKLTENIKKWKELAIDQVMNLNGCSRLNIEKLMKEASNC